MKYKFLRNFLMRNGGLNSEIIYMTIIIITITVLLIIADLDYPPTTTKKPTPWLFSLRGYLIIVDTQNGKIYKVNMPEGKWIPVNFNTEGSGFGYVYCDNKGYFWGDKWNDNRHNYVIKLFNIKTAKMRYLPITPKFKSEIEELTHFYDFWVILSRHNLYVMNQKNIWKIPNNAKLDFNNIHILTAIDAKHILLYYDISNKNVNLLSLNILNGEHKTILKLQGQSYILTSPRILYDPIRKILYWCNYLDEHICIINRYEWNGEGFIRLKDKVLKLYESNEYGIHSIIMIPGTDWLIYNRGYTSYVIGFPKRFHLLNYYAYNMKTDKKILLFCTSIDGGSTFNPSIPSYGYLIAWVRN